MAKRLKTLKQKIDETRHTEKKEEKKAPVKVEEEKKDKNQNEHT